MVRNLAGACTCSGWFVVCFLGVNLFSKSDSKTGFSGVLAICFQAGLLVFHLFKLSCLASYF